LANVKKIFSSETAEEKILLSIDNRKKELFWATLFIGQMERNGETLLRTLHRCLLPNVVPFGQVVSEEKIKM
jgi:hypothetical protein